MRPLFILIVTAILLSACSKQDEKAEDQERSPLYDRGETVFMRRCSTCHDLIDPHHPGPVLSHLKGRRAGTQPGFPYSPAMRNAGITWSAEVLDKYLQGPQTVVPNTFMQIEPVTDDGERKALIEFLMQQ